MSESTRDRLARLRREQRPRVAPALEPAPRGALPVWLRARLGARAPAAPPAGPRTAGPPADLAPLEGPLGAHAARTTRYAVEHVHGAWSLAEAREQAPGSLELVTRGDAPREPDLDGAVFLDIETTGLSGGAGIHTFLVGLAWFEGDALVVQQSFLEGPEGERALLASVAERLARAHWIVTFFGKSFDRHRLEDKMRIHGVRAPFGELAHADLYWPCRRLYASELPDTRLATMERALCGLEREADLSGAHAPEAWFDFLAGRAHRLEEVFRHNLDDVLSLVTLTAHLGRATAETRRDGTPLGPDPALAGARAAGLAELCAARRDHAQALTWIERALARGPVDAARPRLESRRATAVARLGRHAEALELWADLANGPPSDLTAEACLNAAQLALRGQRGVGGSQRDRARQWLDRAERVANEHTAGVRRASIDRRVAGLRARIG